MWRSTARILHRSLIGRHPQVPPETLTLTLISPPPPISTSHSHPPRSNLHTSIPLASNNAEVFDLKPENLDLDGNALPAESPPPISQAAGDDADSSPVELDDGAERDAAISEEPGEAVAEAEGPHEIEIDVGKLERVISLLRTALPKPPLDTSEGSEIAQQEPSELIETSEGSEIAPEETLDASLDDLDISLSEEFVARLIQTPDVPVENLVGFLKWAIQYDDSTKSTRLIDLLVSQVELNKNDVYVVWDLVKELGKEKGLLTTAVLNQLISLFWKLGKAKAGLEVFRKFAEFGCDRDGDTYYLTIQALSQRPMFNPAPAVVEKMVRSGNFPDSEKVGEIVVFLCHGGKEINAYVVYTKAKKKGINVPISSLDLLIDRLSRKVKTKHFALELLKDYPWESLKHANKVFSSVVRVLCQRKDLQEAKKLLLRMVDSGPPPGNAAFNYVISALCREGDVEDALALLKVMESRGLRPDVYTYSVIMSGFAKGGLMDEAYKIFCEAKKNHTKLTPVTYHILTRGYCKMEQFDKALDCLKEMKEDGLRPNIDEYNKMIQTLCLKALDWRKAEKVVEEMEKSGLRPKGMASSLITAMKELEQEER